MNARHLSLLGALAVGVALGAIGSGIFGASSLLLSFSAETRVPEQKESEIRLSSGAIARALFSGGLGGSVVAWIPGVSPSVAAITARLGASPIQL